METGTERLGIKNTHMHVAEITWHGAFPLDMLRYESAHPLEEGDSHIIGNSLNPMIDAKENTARVRKFGDSKANWSYDRWNSFHCKVTPVDRFTDRPPRQR